MRRIALAYSPARPRLRRASTAVASSEPFALTRRGRARLPVRRELGLGTAVALVTIATLAGAAIRLPVRRGLSPDEVGTADLAHLSLGALISRLAHAGVQPPLSPAVEWFAVRLAGGGDYALRLPSLAAGIALIPVVGWLGGELFDRRTAAAGASFAAVAPALVWYSQEASRFALVALFGALAVVGAVRLIRRGASAADWALYTVAASLAVWSDWSGVFVVAGSELVLLAVVIYRRRASAQVRPFVAAWGLATVALGCQLVALGVLFASQVSHAGGVGGVVGVSASGVSFYTTVSNVSWGLFGFHPAAVTGVLSALWPLGMLASLVMIGREAGARAWLLLGCAAVPAVGVLVLGVAVAGAFDVRYALASVPLVLVLVGHVATAWPRSRLGRGLVVGAIVVLLLGALVDQQLDPRNPRRYDYSRAFARVQRDAAPGAAVFYEPAALRPVLSHYAPGLRGSALSTRLPARAGASGVFVIASFENSPRLQALLDRELGALRATRRLVSHDRYPGVGVWWFR